MKKDKKRIREALLEGLVELVATLLFFGIGAFIVSLFDVSPDTLSSDSDLLVFIGIVAFFGFFAIVFALVEWLKKIKRDKKKKEYKSYDP